MPRGTRPRADCPRCGRSTAVTFNKRTGEAYLRSHSDPRTSDGRGRNGAECTLSRQVVERQRVR